MRRALPAILFAGCACAATPGAAEIMARVAVNQDRAQAARSAWVYEQSVLVRMKRPNGKLAREERREFVVTPRADGAERELKHFSGKVERKAGMVEYSDPDFKFKEVDLDGELSRDLANDFAGDSKSKDGVSAELFPLSAEEQRKYDFTLEGAEQYRGREVYKLRFRPKKGGTWAGEALIDAAEFQPVMVTTVLGRGIPVWVKTLLGTDLKQLGFKISYQKVAEGLWFPSSWGGEFSVRGVFVYRRKVSISVSNRGFQQTEVTSRVTFGGAKPEEPKP